MNHNDGVRLNSELVDSVREERDPMTLLVIEAIAHEMLANMELKDEREWLLRRDREEEERLAYA